MRSCLWLLLVVATSGLAQPDWSEALRLDFEAGALEPSLVRAIPPDARGISFGPGQTGQAVHLSAAGHNVGLGTRRRFAPPFSLEFDYLQPAAEAGGYRLVVTHPTREGQTFWFEVNQTDCAVWTDADGTWAPRWSSGGLTVDAWHQVTIDVELERVRLRVDGPGGVALDSDWLPHDELRDGPLELRADSGSTLPACGSTTSSSVSLPLTRQAARSQLPTVCCGPPWTRRSR